MNKKEEILDFAMVLVTVSFGVYIMSLGFRIIFALLTAIF